jgi:hypothetical protein
MEIMKVMGKKMQEKKTFFQPPTDDDKRKVVQTIVKSIRTVSDQNGKRKNVEKLTRLADLPERELQTTVSRLSPAEKNELLRAFADLDRVAGAIVSTNV